MLMYLPVGLCIQRRTPFKGARSVFCYPFNQLQCLQYVKYTRFINSAKGIQIKHKHPCQSRESNPGPLTAV